MRILRDMLVGKVLRVLLAAVVLLLIQGCWKKPPPHNPEVTVYTVDEREVDEVLTLVGKIVADFKVDLVARVDGFLEKRAFDEGAFVRKDEMLFQIEKDQYQAAVDQAEANLAIKEAVLKNAVISYERMKYLRGKDSVSEADLDKATADKDAAVGERDAAKAMLADARVKLGYTDIKAPFDGRVGLSTYTVGNVVGPASGALALLVSLDPICVEFSVPEPEFLRNQLKAVSRGIPFEEYISNLKVGLTLSDKTEYKLNGKVYFWDNVVQSGTGTVLMRARFENPDFVLVPGQYVRGNLRRAVPLKELVMPQAAMQFALGSTFVMTVDENDTVRNKTVETGYRYQDMVVVLDGLKPGDRVVTGGIQKVREGMRVAPVQDESPQGKSPGPGKEKPEIEEVNQNQIL
ncbi:MAG: efflux RND transporter periplasmic adaptor subunit [Victivallales bacterium]|nr:efflux RND transporter periplasmic adaptor subunit [Victivallales bacterium]